MSITISLSQRICYLLLGVGALLALLSGLLATTKRSLDLYLFDRYFLIVPSRILFLSALLVLAALAIWKGKISRWRKRSQMRFTAVQRAPEMTARCQNIVGRFRSSTEIRTPASLITDAVGTPIAERPPHRSVRDARRSPVAVRNIGPHAEIGASC